MLHAFESVLLPINEETYGATIFGSRSISSRSAEMQFGLSSEHRGLVKVLLEEVPCSWFVREWNYTTGLKLRFRYGNLFHVVQRSRSSEHSQKRIPRPVFLSALTRLLSSMLGPQPLLLPAARSLS